jgi:hypothetical protein
MNRIEGKMNDSHPPEGDKSCAKQNPPILSPGPVASVANAMKNISLNLSSNKNSAHSLLHPRAENGTAKLDKVTVKARHFRPELNNPKIQPSQELPERKEQAEKSESAGFSPEVQPNHFNNAKRLGISSVMKKSLVELVDLMRQHMDIPTSLRNNVSGQLRNTQLADECAQCKCSDCNKLKIEFRLSCLHSTCLNCFISKIEGFERNPSLESFQALACSACQLNYCEDVFRVAGSRKISSLKSLQRTCQRCGLAKPLITEYFSELSCGHLCGNCYADELLFNSKKCLCCNIEFKNAKSTLMRTAACVACRASGFQVSEIFRAIHVGEVLCYNCLAATAQQKRCNACGIDLGKYEMYEIVTLLAKNCSICKEKKSIPDLFGKKCCEYCVCNECQGNCDRCLICGKSSI